MTFAYDGSKYNGYQKQPRVKTIQGEIEKAIQENEKKDWWTQSFYFKITLDADKDWKQILFDYVKKCRILDI